MTYPRLTIILQQLCLLILMLSQEVHSLPTINQQQTTQKQQLNYLPRFDKDIFQQVTAAVPSPQLRLEDTIEEVQKILSHDPTLPRLTRGEIEELYEKVPREEYEKSIEAGDMGRADSMRALMLVLPYNTDNSTEENLQELFTRPPVTKVIDAYTPPQPIKFLTPDPNSENSPTHQVGNLAATTYKPLHPLKNYNSPGPSPTTYHPQQPPVMYRMTPSLPMPQSDVGPMQFLPIMDPANSEPNTNTERMKPLRFSSHYNAKNTEFHKLSPSRKAFKSPQTPTAPAIAIPKRSTTVKPVADVLESLGIVGQTQSRHRYTADDYFAIAESAPRPVISPYIPQTSQSLSARIRPEAYSSFKPLNIGEEIRVQPEVEGYLTRFGIVGGRKRKELKKGGGGKGADLKAQGSEDQASVDSLQSTAKVARNTGESQSSELSKLLENLQELERLNVNAKNLAPSTTTAPRTTRKPTTTTTTTTTTTSTTPASVTLNPNLITNGAPLLIEAKKPRRRIDPNIDINFGSAGNQQTDQGNADQLSKLLENLQELEKLQITSDTLKKAAPTKPITPVTTAPPLTPLQSQTLTNRFSELNLQQQLQQQTLASNSQNDAQQLQRVLQELQALERANARTSTTPKPKTTPKSKPNVRGGNFAPTDLFQLQRLLSDDRELERLYEQARARYPTKKPTATTTTSTTTTTTRAPVNPSQLSDIERLQQYFAELDRAQPSSTPSTTRSTPSTTRSTTSSTTTTTTTTTTTPKPTIATADIAQRIIASNQSQKSKKTSVESAESQQLQELINRVQQLERLNANKADGLKEGSSAAAVPPPTQSTMPFLGFTSRNVNEPVKSSPSNGLSSGTNDFAHLQQLYDQVQQAEQASFGRIEISTAATASKAPTKRPQNFAQRIIDITNDTGSGSSLHEVDPNDFVQLQKLLSKVQELERVRINSDGTVESATPNPRLKTSRIQPTSGLNLVTAASVNSQNTVNHLSGAQIVYPEKPSVSSENLNDYQFDLPAYESATPQPEQSSSHVSKKANPTLHVPTSSEELHELAYSEPANPRKAAPIDSDFEKYQQFFSKLEDAERSSPTLANDAERNSNQNIASAMMTNDAERNSYLNMQPPMIYKTVTKEPPRFIATHKPLEKTTSAMKNQQADLIELQKLLNNAKELKDLGVNLPDSLSQQLETKLTKAGDLEAGFKKMQTTLNNPIPLSSVPPTEVEEYLTRYGIIDDRERTEDASTTQKPTTTTTTTTHSPFYPTTSSNDIDLDDSKEKTAVFSLTTMKSLLPKEPKPTATTESALELPVFSATKIIEAAIKRAATRIGVSTEHPQGFRRRSDNEGDFDEMSVGDDAEGELDGDLMGEFSELNYQMAIPDINRGLYARADKGMDEMEVDELGNDETATAEAETSEKSQDISTDLREIQRLISNLQELQKLNISTSSDVLRKADAAYLNSLKKQSTPDDDTIKSRRQSATPPTSTPITIDLPTQTPVTTTTTSATAVSESTTASPTRVNFDLSLDDSDTDSAATNDKDDSTTSTTTEESRNGSLADLEDSFGGPDPNKEEPLPPKKKNGFYFLADWNSFLEVGDGDDQVVVRLSPKIGDPRLFIPVKIP